LEEQVAQLSPRKLEFDWCRDDDSDYGDDEDDYVDDDSDNADDYGVDKNPDEWMSSSG